MQKYELMIDIETLDTKQSAVVLSIGAVIWENRRRDDEGGVHWNLVEDFYQVLDIDSQISRGRTVSQSTLLWWMDQDQEARDAAFVPAEFRVGPKVALTKLFDWVEAFNNSELVKSEYMCFDVTRYWASPNTFDFPIIENLAEDFKHPTVWFYNQKRDVRTVIDEASYSVDDHKYYPEHHDNLERIPTDLAHHPLYDCCWQIDVLTAARSKLNRKRIVTKEVEPWDIKNDYLLF